MIAHSHSRSERANGGDRIARGAVEHGFQWLHKVGTDAALRELVTVWHSLAPEVREKDHDSGPVFPVGSVSE